MKTLQECQWQAYELSKIFTIKATKSGIDRNKLNGKRGDIPYITRTDVQNGWDDFIGVQDKYMMDEGNVISIGLDTQTAFYQPIAFYTGQNIQVFSSEKINRYVANFIIPLLKIQMEKFNWGGNGATLGRLKRVHIMLPSTPKGEPDYSYMEEYMRSIETKLLNIYKLHLTQSTDNQQITGGVLSHNGKRTS